MSVLNPKDENMVLATINKGWLEVKSGQPFLFLLISFYPNLSPFWT